MTPTGDCGLIEKVFVMDCFGNVMDSNVRSKCNEDTNDQINDTESQKNEQSSELEDDCE